MTDLKLYDFSLPISLQKYLALYWDDKTLYYNFLKDKILEKNISITPWEKSSKSNEYNRTVKSLHPLPYSLPWLPLSVKSKTQQSISSSFDNSTGQVIVTISEKSTIQGIPYAQPTILTIWSIKSIQGQKNSIQFDIQVQFSYDKPTFLKVAIESNTRNELIKYFKLYKHYVISKTPLTEDDSTSYINHVLVDLLDSSYNNQYINSINSLDVSTIKNDDNTLFENDSENFDNVDYTLSSFSLINDDYELLLLLNYDDIEEALNILKYSIENFDLVYYYIRNHLIYNFNLIINLIIFMTSLKTIEYDKWITYDRKASNFIITIIKILFCYIISLSLIKFLYVLLERKRDRSQSFHAMKLDIKQFSYNTNDFS